MSPATAEAHPASLLSSRSENIDCRDEGRERRNVDADRVPPRCQRFYERGSAADMIIKHRIARLGQGRNDGTDESGAESSRVFVEAVR